MGGVLVLLVLVIGALVAYGQLSRRLARVHDPSGRSVGGTDSVRVALGVVIGLLVLILLGTTFRVVPVGHGLVVFNTVSK